MLQKAKKAKENAAREAMEAQGLVPKPPTADATSTSYGVDAATSSPTTNAVTPTNSPSSSNSTAVPTARTGLDPTGRGPGAGVSSDD